MAQHVPDLNTMLCGTPSIVYCCIFGFAKLVAMHHLWTGSVRDSCICNANEAVPPSRASAPSTVHIGLSKASAVEKQEFDEATVSYKVWEHLHIHTKCNKRLQNLFFHCSTSSPTHSWIRQKNKTQYISGVGVRRQEWNQLTRKWRWASIA